MKIIGIDDAGRGPVIGPMVLAGILIEENENEKLKKIGVKDSKLLYPDKRAKIKKKLEKYKSYTEIAHPQEIDSSTNLNYLEAKKTAKIINKLAKELNEPATVIVDCPSPNIVSWKNQVWHLVEKKEIISLVCEHKADQNHPSVSAASIIAKEKREEEITKLKKELSIDFGSGYSSDPKTIEFVKKNLKKNEFKSIIRSSWDTFRKAVRDSEQKKLFQ